MATISRIDEKDRNVQLLNNYKKHYRRLNYVQDLTVSDLDRVLTGDEIRWDELVPHDFLDVNDIKLTQCQINIGIVIYDCFCLAIGALALKSALKPDKLVKAASLIYDAAGESVTSIEKLLYEMGPKTSNVQKAWKVIQIIFTMKDGGQLDLVWNAFIGSLTWYSALLYGMQGLVTIFAAVATGGLALASQIALVLIGATFLALDVVAAVKSCNWHWETPTDTPNITPGGMAYRPNIAIKTSSGNYVSFYKNGGIGNSQMPKDSPDIVHTDSTSVGGWEKITLEPHLAENDFNLKTESGNYISAVNGGGMGNPPPNLVAPLHTNATSIGEWEKLILIEQVDGTYALATTSGYYLVIEGGGGRGTNANISPIHTNATNPGEWERFTFVEVI